jgi:CRP/FNR family transcriptional regulator, nitrogen fixation regulation protein
MEVVADLAASQCTPWSCRPAAMERMATPIQLETGDTVYRCGERALYWYRILKGTVRKSTLSANGQRQIVDFLVTGDLFGFGESHEHQFSTEVISAGTRVARYPRKSAEQLVECDPQVGRLLRKQAFDSILRLQTRTLILGRTGALARVSAFLLDWADRCGPARSADISLPMSRYDVADYVSMAVETVCRALSVLRERQVIATCGSRRLRICDRRLLERVREGEDPTQVRGLPSRTCPAHSAMDCN